MLKDYSYGIIPLMKKDDTRYTILIHLASWDHRWIPKWHGEAWETPLQSAMREFYEETGLHITEDQVNITDQYTENYISRSKRHNQDVNKTVLYYTAILPYTDVSLLSGYSEWDGEILGKQILTLDNAIETVTYNNIREVLQQVKNRL